MIRKIAGHSMTPTLPPGTTVWGFKWFNRLRVGDVIIFSHQGKEKIKRIHSIEDDMLEVRGDNPEDSSDSRKFGKIDTEEVLAKVVRPKTNLQD